MKNGKRPIYLWILLVISSLSSLSGVLGLLRTSQTADEAQLRELYKAANIPDDSINQIVAFVQKSAEANQNVLVLILPVILALLLVVAWIFFVKKDIAKTNFIYLGYLVLRIVVLIYGYVVTMGIANSVLTDSTIRSLMVTSSQVMTFVFFGIYVLFLIIVLYKMWRQNQAVEEE